MIIRKILGLGFAAAIVYAAWYLYVDYIAILRLLRGTLVADIVGIGTLRNLQLIVWAIVVFFMLWLAEKIQDKAAARFWPETDH